MSQLDDFQAEDRAMIVSLAVRIGFWIAGIDDAPGNRDDAREALALELALKKIVASTGDDALTNDVAEFALAGQGDWPEWERASDTALDDLPRALRLIAQTSPAPALTAYKKMLYFIANVVAQAASERGDAGRAGAITAIADRLSVKADLSTPDNVSASEKAALQKLLGLLKA